MRSIDFEVRSTWDGEPLDVGEFARVGLRVDASSDRVELRVEASFHDDPPPDAPPGSLDGLWEFEVVELFLLGDEERYLEIELGPRGHHLGLLLAGRRNVVEDHIPIDFEVELRETSWSGVARFSAHWLPRPLRAGNAYAIHGEGSARRYLAAHPVPGESPDFHRLECFASLDDVQ